MNQADWDLYIKSSKTSANAYQSLYEKKRKEEEEKKKNEVVFGDTTGTSTTSSKANAVEQGKGFWEGVGDFAKGVGTTVVEGVKGAGDFAVETAKGIGNLIDTDAKMKKEQEYQKNKNEYLKQFLGDEKKYLEESAKYSEEHKADRGNIDWAKQKEDEAKFKEAGQKTYKLAQYIPGVSLGVEGAGTVAAAIQGDEGDINKGLIELTQSKDWDKLSDEEKKQALIQRNLGGALSTLDLLPLVGKAAGVGIKTGIKEGAEAGFKAAGKEIAQSVGSKTIKEVASVGAKELAKQTVKSSVTGAVVGAGLGVGLNAVMGGKDWQQAAIEGAKSGFIGGFIGSPLDIDVKNVLKETGKNSLDVPDETLKAIIDDIDATTAKTAEDARYIESRKAEFEQIMANRQAGLADDGSKIINLEDNERQLADMQSGRYTDDMYDIIKSDGTPADPEFIKAATQKQVDLLTEKRDAIAQQVDAITDPAAREMAMQNVNKIDDQIASIKSGDTTALMETGAPGITRKLNTDRVRERFNQLQNERAEGNFRQQAERDAAAKRTAPTRTFDQVSSEIDALGAGGVAPDAVTPRPDFTDVKEIAELDNMPMQLKGRATVLANDKLQLEMQRADIMTRAKADSTLDELDMNFNKKMSRIDMMPEPRRTAEMEKLQSEYEKSYADIEDQVARDADKATQLDRVEAQIIANSNELLADANLIKDRNPTEFGIVHEEMNQKISQEIEQEAETAIFNRMSNKEGVPEAENVNKAIADIPDNATPEQLDSPQARALNNEAVKETWENSEANILEQNLQGVSRGSLALAASSPSSNIRSLFGELGRKINGTLISAFKNNNRANLVDASNLTKIQKLAGKDINVYNKYIDIIEGKDVDTSGFTQSQQDGLTQFKDWWASKKVLVKKAATLDVINDFDKRAYSGDIKYTVDEIKKFAKRDNTTIEVAKAKYSNITSFDKNDVVYLANYAGEHATRENYYAHILDEERVSKNAVSEYMKDFDARRNSGKFEYTPEELKILANRDGITVPNASKKYAGKLPSNKDIKYLKSSVAADAVKREKIKYNEVGVTGEVKFSHMMRRLANNDDYSRDIIDVMSKYAVGLNKKLYLEPAFKTLDNAKLVLQKSELETNVTEEWLDVYLKQMKRNQVSAIGEKFNSVIDGVIAKNNPNSKLIGSNHYRSSLAAQRMVNSLGILGFSFKNGIQQLSQIITSVSKLGWENMLPGMIEHTKASISGKDINGNPYRTTLDSAGVLNAGMVDDAFTDLIGTTSAKAVENTGEFLSKYIMFMSRWADEFVRGSTYQASLHESLKNKIPFDEAQNIATAHAAELNFLTTKVDMPTMLNSDGIRSLSQFLTFSYKQAESWKDITVAAVKDQKTNTLAFKPKELQRIIQGIATAAGMYSLLEVATGTEAEDNIPFLGNFKDGSLPTSPLVQMFIGRENQPSFITLLQDISNPDGEDEITREMNKEESINKFRDMLIKYFVPAGGQMQKSYSGYQSIQNEGVVSKDGKVRYIQNTDEASKLKATLFGQYSTEAGKEWINKKFPTLSEKQSETLNAQKTAEAKKRAYDFYAGLKATTTKSTVTPKIKETIKTQPAKAERLIREHNASVQKAVQEYVSKYGELSTQEQDYLAEKYFITYGTLENLNEE